MNKNIIMPLAAIALFGAGIVVSPLLIKPAQPHTSDSSAKTYSIAILSPISVPALETIERGLKTTLGASKKAQYTFTTFNANGDRTLLNSYAQKITQQSFDAVVTLGSGATQIMYEVSSKRKSTTPVIFTAVEQPEKMGIIESKESSGNHLTGIEEVVAPALQIRALTTMRPDVKTLAIVYNPSAHGLQALKVEYVHACHEAGIGVKFIEIFATNELSQKVPAGINGCDALLIMKDVIVASGIDLLVKLCNRHHVTLIASDLDSGDKGAAIGFGSFEYSFGSLAARQVREVLEEGKAPRSIPIQPNDGFCIVLNKKTMHDQGITLNPREQFILEKCTEADSQNSP